MLYGILLVVYDLLLRQELWLLLSWMHSRGNLLHAGSHRLKFARLTLHLPLHDAPRVLHSLWNAIRTAHVRLHLLTQYPTLVIVGRIGGAAKFW